VRGYTLYQNGEKQEEFSAEDGVGVKCSSLLRKVQVTDIKDARKFTDEFFRSHDALDAGITFEYFLRTDLRYKAEWKPGQEKLIGNVGFPLSVGAEALAITKPPIERVDLVTLP
jgi:hypothetical protein